MNFGIIGYGSFGQYLTKILLKYGNVSVVSKRDVSKELPPRATQVTMDRLAGQRIIIIASSLEEMPAVCQELAEYVSPETLVLDVCSVKVRPVEIMKQYLGGKCQLLATHPLFGPQTQTNGKIAGQKIVIYPIELNNPAEATSLLRDYLRLEVIEMDPDQHDREMAWVHGLTFFVGRGLLKLEPPKSPLATGYYQKMLDLVELEGKHTVELFKTIEQGNPYAEEVRKNFLDVLQQIDTELKDTSK